MSIEATVLSIGSVTAEVKIVKIKKGVVTVEFEGQQRELIAGDILRMNIRFNVEGNL